MLSWRREEWSTLLAPSAVRRFDGAREFGKVMASGFLGLWLRDRQDTVLALRVRHEKQGTSPTQKQMKHRA